MMDNVKVEKEELKSILHMKNLYFEKIIFERGENLPDTLTPQFATEYHEITETEIEVKLKCRILSDGKPMLELILVGVFDNTGSDPEITADLFELNTVSIMFPYLRAEISLVTAQPNFPTLNLPVFNINALMEDLKK